MKHQLVLQFSPEDLDAVVAIEDALISELDSSVEVGSGLLPPDLKAAFRAERVEHFIVLWPRGESQFRIA